MRSPPKFLEGAYVSAVRLAMEEVRKGRHNNNDARRIRPDVVGTATEGVVHAKE